MPTETTERDASTLPAYLIPPVCELQGPELSKYKLNSHARRSTCFKNFFSSNKSHFIKRGRRVRLTEALTMDFIAQHTTIRVPRVLDVFTIDGTVHIVQEFIDAPVLEDVWHKLSPAEQRSSMAQLKDCLDQLRALKPPHPRRVEAVDGSGIIDGRVAGGEWGPFDDHDAFHHFLSHDSLRAHPERYPLVQEALFKVHGRRYRTVFSHGDLGPHNLLWKDGRIVVIDWENSGWLPEYWDYIRVYAARGDVLPKWWMMFRETVDRYDDELELAIRTGDYVESL